MLVLCKQKAGLSFLRLHISFFQCSHNPLSFCRDPSWDINDYLLGLRADCKSWREVYWRLWATVNHLTCSRCKLVFPCSELGHCRFHPELPKFDNLVETVKSSAVGTYGCCQQKTLRFDPLNQNTVCGDTRASSQFSHLGLFLIQLSVTQTEASKIPVWSMV